jgi:hypothetical protein
MRRESVAHAVTHNGPRRGLKDAAQAAERTFCNPENIISGIGVLTSIELHEEEARAQWVSLLRQHSLHSRVIPQLVGNTSGYASHVGVFPNEQWKLYC